MFRDVQNIFFSAIVSTPTPFYVPLIKLPFFSGEGVCVCVRNAAVLGWAECLN
jgi:hypothetical protein